MRRDPWNHEQKYLNWRSRNAEGIDGLTTANSRHILAFLRDMEIGRNTATGTKKGGRSYIRLRTLAQRLVFAARALQERWNVADLTLVDEEALHEFFGGMRSGTILRRDGKRYRSVGDYVNVFKTFWHWHMKVQRKRGHAVLDICQDLDYRSEKAPWVLITEEDLEKLCRHANFKYRVLMQFLFDTGMRAPTELLNVRVDDFNPADQSLRISEDASKTFGRTIKLMRCTDLLKEHLREHQLKPSDYLFTFHPATANKYLKRLGGRVLGTQRSPGGKRYDQLTLYDFRHSSACYWLRRYKSETGFKYRFGWKRSSMIEYYTCFLGMRDTITEADLTPDNQAPTTELNGLLNLLQQTMNERLLQTLMATHQEGPLASAKPPNATPRGNIAGQIGPLLEREVHQRGKTGNADPRLQTGDSDARLLR